jgi:hypothetical protein
MGNHQKIKFEHRARVNGGIAPQDIDLMHKKRPNQKNLVIESAKGRQPVDLIPDLPCRRTMIASEGMGE